MKRHLMLSVLAALWLLELGAVAQRPGPPEVTLGGGFRAPIYDRDRSRPLGLVSGREAKPALIAGQLVVTDFRLETYRYAPDRMVDLTVESPSAVFDARGATSGRSIELKDAAGRFAVTGEGWSWDQATGVLVVSNRVSTDLKSGGGEVAKERWVQITASRLEYNLKNGDTRFTGDCVAIQPGQARLAAKELVSRLSPDTQRPDAILASGDVIIEMLRPGREGRASGGRARYAVETGGEVIEITESPVWTLGPGSGSADRLFLQPRSDAYRAEGHARMRVEARRGGDQTGGSPPMDVACERIEATPGEVLFSGGVTAVQTNRLSLSASQLVTTLGEGVPTGSAALVRAVATGAVVARVMVKGQEVELGGETMTYTVGEHPQIEVEGDPRWRAPGYEGRGGRFLIQPDKPLFLVRGDVAASWQAGAATGSAVVPVRVQSREMRVEGEQVHFTGGVLVSRSDWELRGREVDLWLGTNSALREVVAREDVRLEYLARRSEPGEGGRGGLLGALVQEADEKARRWTITASRVRAGVASPGASVTDLEAEGGVEIAHVALKASGERLVYRAADGAMRLTGDARLTTVEGMEIVGQPGTALALDPGQGRFRVEGPVRKMRMPSRALASGGESSAPAARDGLRPPQE